MCVWCSPAAVRASLKKRRRADESGAACTPGPGHHRSVQPHVHGLVDRAHSSSTGALGQRGTGDPPARLDTVVEPAPAVAPDPVADPRPQQSVNQLQPINGCTDVVLQPRVSSDEVRQELAAGPALGSACTPRPLRRRDRLPHSHRGRRQDLLCVCRQWVWSSLNLREPPGGPSIERSGFGPRAMMPRTDFRLNPNRSPITSNERLSAV